MKKIIFDLDGVIFAFLFFLMSGAKKVLKRLHEEKYEILILTAREGKLFVLGEKFLKLWGLGFLKIVSSNGSKGDVIV